MEHRRIEPAFAGRQALMTRIRLTCLPKLCQLLSKLKIVARRQVFADLLVIAVVIVLLVSCKNSTERKLETWQEQIGEYEIDVVGQKIFEKKCADCHTLNKPGLWPDLAGITDVRSEEWIKNLLLNTQDMFENDPVAQRILMEHEEFQMPNNNLSEEEADAVIAYLKTIKVKVDK